MAEAGIDYNLGLVTLRFCIRHLRFGHRAMAYQAFKGHPSVQSPAGVELSDRDGIVTIRLPRIEGKRLVRLMAPYLLLAIVAIGMFAFGVWHFGTHWVEVQREVPILPQLFLSFMALFFVLAVSAAVTFYFANRCVTIRVDGEGLTVSSEGSIGQKHYYYRRTTITAVYADRYWLWVHGSERRPSRVLWQRLPEERHWLAVTLARQLGVRGSLPLGRDELEVRVVILDDDKLRRCLHRKRNRPLFLGLGI